MKIVHCVGWYFPESLGGSEVYVQRLARELGKLGHESVILAPRDGYDERRYTHDGALVLRYPVPEARSAAQREGVEPHARFEVFERLLDEVGADVFHLHSNTYGAGLHHLRAARRRGMRTLVTAHTPGFVCPRGTMMLYGAEACDGRIEVARCTPCWLHARGMPKLVAQPSAALLMRMPDPIRRALPGRARTLLSLPARMQRDREALLELAEAADVIVAVARWLYDALRINGVPEEKLVVCRQGVAAILAGQERGPRLDQGAHAALRVGYFGRGARVKGIDTLVRAVCSLPRACAVELRVHAVTNADEDRAYMDEVRALAQADARIAFLPPVASEAVQRAMRGCDVIAVPSRWLETGPLVALEAIAAGIPVVGSRLGGLAELIEPGVSGWLVEPEDEDAWAAQLRALTAEGAARLPCSGGRVAIQTEAEVATSMAKLYARRA